MGLTSGKFPNRGLRYPKADEKPPFMTMAEIERQLAGGGDPDLLWEALYLQASELTELLAHVKEKAPHPWIYPLFCFAAHTGARRSEILRALVADVDFTGNTVLVREKKRTRGQRTTRRVPLTPFLKEVLTGMAGGPPRRSGPVLPCRHRCPQQEAKPDHRPPERKETPVLAERPDGDGEEAGAGGTGSADPQRGA